MFVESRGSADLHYAFMFCSGHFREKYSNTVFAGTSVIRMAHARVFTRAHRDHKANCDEVLIKMEM